jgi:ankyrin repeat protein
VNIGVDYNSTQLDGMTPLALAIASNSTNVIRYLRSIGAKESVGSKSTNYNLTSTVLNTEDVQKLPNPLKAETISIRARHHC